MNAQAKDYPFAQEFITDAEGQIRKVVIDINDYQKLIDLLEDEGLYRTVTEAHNETPFSLEEAINTMENRNLTIAAAKLSEPVLQKIWDNPEDADYDKL
jgi:hypothetical protein